jgi:XTP/dITP diphosphohydrolase
LTLLLLATNNKGKMIEMQALLSDLPVELITPEQIKLDLEVEEDGQTYAENASRKCLAFARASGLLTLADDSGLEVEALDGAPGIYSARYSPMPGAKDGDRRAFLLQNLKGKLRPWKARFCCAIAIANPDGELKISEGSCPGEIIPEERGENGFGYDPIFYLPELGRTMAQLEIDEKNRLSHRARAIMAAKPLIEELLTY